MTEGIQSTLSNGIGKAAQATLGSRGGQQACPSLRLTMKMQALPVLQILHAPKLS